jgi:hypothetical protein
MNPQTVLDNLKENPSARDHEGSNYAQANDTPASDSEFNGLVWIAACGSDDSFFVESKDDEAIKAQSEPI